MARMPKEPAAKVTKSVKPVFLFRLNSSFTDRDGLTGSTETPPVYLPPIEYPSEGAFIKALESGKVETLPTDVVILGVKLAVSVEKRRAVQIMRPRMQSRKTAVQEATPLEQGTEKGSASEG